MKRLYIVLFSFLLFTLLFFISCTNPPCSNCNDNQYCIGGECVINRCLAFDVDCGKGKCVDISQTDKKPEDTYDEYGQFYICECDKGSTLYRTICVPTCNGFSQNCRDFDKSLTDNGAYNECNMELGHCDSECQGEGSCEEGHYCSIGGTCTIIDGYCNTDNDCIDELDGKTTCNIELNLCESSDSIDTKAEFVDVYSRVACGKYFECNPNIDYIEYPNAFQNLEACMENISGQIEKSLNSDMCEIYDADNAIKVIDCNNEYTCTINEDGLDTGFSSCFNKYYIGMCKDEEGKHEAVVKLANVYCDQLFTCDESYALERYDDLEDCKTRVANENYSKFINEDDCLYYDKDLFDEYITCRESLTCSQGVEECYTKYTLACNGGN